MAVKVTTILISQQVSCWEISGYERWLFAGAMVVWHSSQASSLTKRYKLKLGSFTCFIISS
jgi:hypothetical protein